MAKRSRDYPKLKYVMKDKYGYRYRPYMGRVDGKIVWGNSIWLCDADASPTVLWRAYRKALGFTGNYLKEEVIADAKRYQTRKQWQDNSGKIYRSAFLNGWLDECCQHMEAGNCASDNNVVYIWEQMNPGADHRVYKVGVTSERRGESRIKDCASANGMEAKIVMMLSCDNARAIEKRLLSIGKPVDYPDSFDGNTEFRVMTDKQLGRAVKAAYKMAA